MALLPNERETCFGWDDLNDDCQLITYNKALMRRLDELCKEFPDQYKMVNKIYYDKKLEGKEYTFPKNLVTIRKPSKKRKITDAERKKIANRLAKAREKTGKE